MRIGVGLPNGGSDIDPHALVELARGAERAGLDSVWVVDRWLRPHASVTMPGVPVPITMPAEHYAEVYDPIDLLCFLAARTERILLGTSAITVLYHPPVLLARRLATLDRLSGGRLVAGVTAGWMAEEFAVAGVPPDGAGDRFDEHLAVMRAVWGADPVSFAGRRYAVPVADVGPKPVQRPLPLLVGYTTGAGLRRAARIGDGLHPCRNDRAALAADLAVWRTEVRRHGRDPDQAPVLLRAAAEPRATGADALFRGPPARWGADLDTVERLGVDHVLLQFPPRTGVDETLSALAPHARR